MSFDHGVSALGFYCSGIGYVTPAEQYEVVEFVAVAPDGSIIPLNIDLVYGCGDFVVENMPNGAVRMKGARPGGVLSSGLVNIYPAGEYLPYDKITQLEISAELRPELCRYQLLLLQLLHLFQLPQLQQHLPLQQLPQQQHLQLLLIVQIQIYQYLYLMEL